MKPVRLGFILPQLPQVAALRINFVDSVNRALRLISGHFDSFHIIDHLGIDDIESFTSLAYLSALHPQLKFGHSVICQSFRNPALVARMGATLQFLSGGRFILGIGAGWNEAEYRENGYKFPTAGVRVRQLDEALQIINLLWTEEKASFTGAYYQVVEAACEPKPNPLPPILIGAFGPKMLRIVAKYANDWNVSSTGITRYKTLVQNFHLACEEVDRDPATVQRSWGGGCVCRLNQAEAERTAGDRYGTHEKDDFDFVGTPRQIIEHMQPFIELGVSYFMVDCGGFPDLTTLELLITDVLPALNG